jgi:hypothetical protein
MDGNLERHEEPSGTIIVSLLCLRIIFGDLCPIPDYNVGPQGG